MNTGIIGTSLKENEKRVPIHPDHFKEIAPELRATLFFEKGYGEPFGVGDGEIAELMGGVTTRDEILSGSDLVIQCKPLAADLMQMKMGSVLWGWAHCVQQYDMAQAAIERKLTLITWEGMNTWGKDGKWASHIFYRNNEIAGYAGVLHALSLKGIDGQFGPARKAAVINYGSVGQGALKALRALGFTDISVFVLQEPASIKNVPSDVKVVRIADRGDGHVVTEGAPFIDALEKMDVIVNGMLQDPERPLFYVAEQETRRLKKGTLIIDVSCDEAMGFPFARPTSFEKPMFRFENVDYYAVDHTPSYLWNGTSWEISKALLPYLPTIVAGSSAWEANESVRRAIEIREGVIVNPEILSHQKREVSYPHKVK